jgi:hypothetical protein
MATSGEWYGRATAGLRAAINEVVPFPVELEVAVPA